MTRQFFETQVSRLVRRFGDRAFDPEFVALVADEVKDLPAEAFKLVVDTWIGNRRPHDPPMRADFVEARLAHAKLRLKAEAKGAALGLCHDWGQGLGAYLREHGCKSAWQMVRRIRRDEGGQK